MELRGLSDPGGLHQRLDYGGVGLQLHRRGSQWSGGRVAGTLFCHGHAHTMGVAFGEIDGVGARIRPVSDHGEKIQILQRRKRVGHQTTQLINGLVSEVLFKSYTGIGKGAGDGLMKLKRFIPRQINAPEEIGVRMASHKKNPVLLSVQYTIFFGWMAVFFMNFIEFLECVARNSGSKTRKNLVQYQKICYDQGIASSGLQMNTQVSKQPEDNHNTRTRDVLAASEVGNLEVLKRLLPVVKIPTVWFKAMEHASTYGHMDCLQTLVEHSQNMSTPLVWHKCLVAAAKHGQLECVRYLVQFTDPRNNDSRALRRAAKHGFVDVVQFLLPLSDPKANNCEALINAAWEGHKECIEVLLPHSDPMAQHSEALYAASGRGHAECVKLLLPLSNAKDKDSRCLLRAAANCRLECVKLLIPHSDPTANFSRALAEAFLSNTWEIFDLLYPLSNATEAARFIPGPSVMRKENLKEQWDEKIAARQKQLLQTMVDTTTFGARTRKL